MKALTRHFKTATVVAALFAVSAVPAAAAAPDQPLAPALASEVNDVSEGDVIYGGTTQSTDPTRYDYVPPAGAGGGFTTMGATGYANIGGFTFDYQGAKIGIPGFILQHVISGSGLKINEEVATYTFGVQAQLCNYETHFQNRKGSKIYSTRKSSYHAGCSYGFALGQKVNGPFTVENGAQCARLYVNGAYKGEQCHNVF